MPVTLQQIQAMETDESIAGRLAGAAEAQKRSRLVLVVTGIACAAMIVAAYNAYLSFDRLFTLQQVASKPEDLDKVDEKGTPVPIASRKFERDRGHEILTEQGIKFWNDNRYISISLLGIKVSIDDAPVLGSVALFVISIWFVLAIRREHYTISFLLKDTRQEDPKAPDLTLLKRQWRIFHGIVSNSVFSLYSKRLFPLRGGLAGKVGLEEPAARPGFWAVVQHLFLAALVTLVFWLPVLTSLLLIALDRHSYNLRSPYRENMTAVSSQVDFTFWTWSGVVFVFFFVLLTTTTTIATLYNYFTELLVNEYYGNLKTSLDNLTLPPAATVPPPPVVPPPPAGGEAPPPARGTGG